VVACLPVPRTRPDWRGKSDLVSKRPVPVSGETGTEEWTGSADSHRPVGHISASAALPAEISQLREKINKLSNENERLRAATLTPPGGGSIPAAAGRRTLQSSVVCRRELAVLLRTRRTERGMTFEQVAEHLMCSQSKVRQMENGFRAGTVRDVRDLCDLYDVTEAAERDYLMDLARAGKQRDWGHSYGLPFSTYVGLEVAAASIKVYESAVVPGLLQTEDYARAVLKTWEAILGPEVVEQRVQDRLNRQRQLSRADPPRARFIVAEEVLHRLVGRLVDLARLPNVTIQIIPYRLGAYLAMGSSFAILELAAPIDNVVYVEGMVDSLLLEDSRHFEQYQLAFTKLQEVASNEQELSVEIARINGRF
jgi:transcriptional regulator with XRE-family HTH domain